MNGILAMETGRVNKRKMQLMYLGYKKVHLSRALLCVIDANLHLVPLCSRGHLYRSGLSRSPADRLGEAWAHDRAIVSLLTQVFRRSWHWYYCRWYDSAGCAWPKLRASSPKSSGLCLWPPRSLCRRHHFQALFAPFSSVFIAGGCGSMVTEAILEGNLCCLHVAGSEPAPAPLF
jgi:hypothetical protein